MANVFQRANFVAFVTLILAGSIGRHPSWITAARAAGVHGDAELLRLAAVEQRANRESLRRWSAEVAIDNENRSGDERSVSTTDTIDFVYDQSEGVHWEWKQEWKQKRTNGTEDPLPPPTVVGGATSTREGARYFRPSLEPDRPGADQKIAAYVSAPGSKAAGINYDNFDPIYFYHQDSEDVAERFLFFHALAKKKDLATVFVDRKGSLITLELRHTFLLNRYVVDLDSGGNLVRYFAEESNGPGAGTEESTYQYEQVAGVWVPKRITMKRTSADGRNSLVRVSRWLKNEVNGVVAPDRFTLQAVGVKQGELVQDNRASAIYTYGGPESPGRAQSSSLSWLWPANLALLAVVALYVLVRWRRTR